MTTSVNESTASVNESAAQSEPAGTTTTTVILTDFAAQKVRALLDQEGRDDLRLRVAVQPGGCSGLRYQLFFDERSLDGDVVDRFPIVASDTDSGYGSDAEDAEPARAVEVVVDRMSAPYLTGATIDFADRIDAQGFTIDNPNAGGSCACGDSFH